MSRVMSDEATLAAIDGALAAQQTVMSDADTLAAIDGVLGTQSWKPLPSPAPKLSVKDYIDIKDMKHNPHERTVAGTLKDVGLAVPNAMMHTLANTIGVVDAISAIAASARIGDMPYEDSAPSAGFAPASQMFFGNAGKPGYENDPKNAQELGAVFEGQMSPAQQWANAKAASKAQGGFVDAAKTAVQYPSTTAYNAVNSLFGAYAASPIGRAAQAAGASVPVAAGLAEGWQSMGDTAASITSHNQQTTGKHGMTPEQAALAAGSGVWTAGVGTGFNKLQDAFGLADFDALFLDRAVNSAANREVADTAAKRVLQGAGRVFGSGAVGGGQESLQSGGEAAIGNIAVGKPWHEGVASGMGTGLVAGALMDAASAIGEGAPTAPTQQNKPATFAQTAPMQQFGANRAPAGNALVADIVAAHNAANNPTQPVAQSKQAQVQQSVPRQQNTLTDEQQVAAILQAIDEVKAKQPAQVQQPVQNAQAVPYQSYRRILESGGNPNAKNPQSSATGIDQFTSGTWLGIIKATKPAWAEGKTDAELLPMRTDPQKSTEMVNALDAQNAASLQRRGQPATHHNLYAMHHFGGNGLRFALASLDTPMSDIISPKQLAANKYLAGMTKAQAIANWDARVTGKRGAGVDVSGVQPQQTHSMDIAPDDAGIEHRPALPDDVKQPQAQMPDEPVLQNRNRSTPASIAQMQSIAANPDYGRMGYSRDFANGAPVVAGMGSQIAAQQMGRQDVAVASDGRRIPVQYAVVEADSVLTSNAVDGTGNKDYGNSAVQGVRAIAGNGRIAGVTAAYMAGNADGYRSEMASDDLHGISPDVIASMRNPVLVRVMPDGEVSSNIGDISNTQGGLALNATEQANNDARRIDLPNLQFAPDGGVSQATVRQFVQAMPTSEQGGLIDTNGIPTRQAVDRVNAAIFAKAYGNDGLVRLFAQAQDPEARLILSALAQVAPDMARLDGAGDLDIRDIVAQAAEIAVNARRDGRTIADAAAQLDLTTDAGVMAVLDLFARYPRQSKPVAQALQRAAQFAYQEANKPANDMFGSVPRASRQDVINQLQEQGYGNQQTGQADLGQQGGRQLDGQDAIGRSTDRARPADAGAVETNRAAGTEPAARAEPDARAAYSGYAGQLDDSGRPLKWRTSKGAATLVANELGIDVAGLTGKEIVAAIEAHDAQQQTLTSYDAADLQERDAQQQAADKAEQAEQKRLEDKAKADSQRGEFTLTGSDRAADANPDQGVMFSRAGADATIDVDGVQRPTTKSNGQPIHPTEEGIRNFWRWFGDSKVVDAQGKPLVVYHGTNADFSEFSKIAAADFGHGYYFAANSANAEAWASRNLIQREDGSFARDTNGLKLMPVFLSLQNPASFNDVQAAIKTLGSKWTPQQLTEELQRRGFDGVWSQEDDEIVAFNDTQIKSATGNRGTFSKSNPDIRFSVAPKSQTQQDTGTQEQAALEAVRTQYEGTAQWMKAPNGKPTKLNDRQWLQVRTPQFKEWFGDWETDPANASKVVDENGEPVVVYHGTGSDFTAFDPARIGLRDAGFFGSGFYSTPDEGFAQDYADTAVDDTGEGEAAAMPLYVSLQNPFIWDMSDEGADATRAALAAAGIKRTSVRGNSAALGNAKEREIFNRAVREQGYDGVIVRDEDGIQEVVAFRPEQIKSAIGNTGAFSKSNPDIRFSRRQNTKAEQEKNLIAQHNLTARALLHAVKMGGLPVPSVAITKVDSPLDNFGEITLLGEASMIDPKASRYAKVFGADVYSPRYPTVVHKITSQALAELNKLLKPFNDGGGLLYSRDVREPRDLRRYIPFQHYAAHKLGKDVSALKARDFEAVAEGLLTEAGAPELILKGFSSGGVRQFVPHTLENVVKLLKKKELRGGEGLANDAGSVRAQFTPQFKSIEQIRQAKDSLVTAADFERIKQDIDAEFAIASKAISADIYSDTAAKIMADAARVGVQQAASNYGITVDDAAAAKVEDFLAKLRNLPTEYFEAKITRAVSLSEFAAAVVPEDASAEVMQALRDAGIDNIRTYVRNDAASRKQAIQAATAERDGLRFSQSHSTKAAYEARIDALFAGEHAKTGSNTATPADVQDIKSAATAAVGQKRAAKVDVLTRDEAGKRSGLERLMGVTKAQQEAEGYFDPATGQVVLVADNIKDVKTKAGKVVMTREQRAAYVAWHELTHRALAAKGQAVDGVAYGVHYNAVIDGAGSNATVRALANAIHTERKGEISHALAVEEAMATLRPMIKSGDYAALQELYGVAVPKGMQAGLRGAFERFVQGMRRLIARITGADTAQWDDAQVFEVLAGLDRHDTARYEGEGAGGARESLVSANGLNKEQSREKIQNLAEQAAQRLRDNGFVVDVEHSGSAAGASSYLDVSDPITGARLQKQIRISAHDKGAFNSQFVVNVGSMSEVDGIVEKLLEQRTPERIERIKRIDERSRLEREQNRAAAEALLKKRLLSADEKIARGEALSKTERRAVLLREREMNGEGAAADMRFSTAPQPQGASGEQGNAWQAPEPTRFDDVVYQLQNKHVDLKRVIESIEKAHGAPLADAINPLQKEELYHGMAAKRTQMFEIDELQPLLKTMTRLGVEMGAVEEYLHARHAQEANAVIAARNPDNPNLADGGSGMSNAAAKAYFAKLDAATKTKLQEVAAQVDAIIEGTRQLYVEYGLEDQQTVDGWRNMFEHYIPLMREGKEGGMGIGQGFSVKGKEAKSRTGSHRKVVDIIANIALQRERVITRGEKNRVSVALVGLVALNPNPDFWKREIKPPKVRMFDAELNKVVERIDPLYKSRDNVVSAKVLMPDGSVREEVVEFNADNARAVRIAKALKNLDAPAMGAVLNASAKVVRYVSSINTQYNPVFGPVNMIRDVQSAMLNLSGTPLAGEQAAILTGTVSALKDVFVALRDRLNGKEVTSEWGKLLEQFELDGGATGYRDLFKTSADRADALKKRLEEHKLVDAGALRNPAVAAQQGFGALLNWLDDYNNALENATRLSVYKAALDKGLSRQKAASLAKNMTVNFNRKGAVGSQMGAVYAFFNAAMQGSARIGQLLFTMEGGDLKTLRLSQSGKRVVAGGVALGVLQALALAAAGFDEEEPPEFVRERNLIIPTGNGKYISIPMPQGYHVLPGIGRHLTQWALSGFDKTPKRLVQMLGMFVEAFNPMGGSGISMQTVAPTVLDPAVALLENKDHASRTIARKSRNSTQPGFTQGKDTATWIAKLTAEGINWISGGNQYRAGEFSPTPDQIDYLIGQVTGGVGREASKLQQSVSALVTGEELPPHKVPGLGRFYGDTKSQSAQMGKFYRTLDDINALEYEVKAMRKDGKWQEAGELLRGSPYGRMVGYANATENRLTNLRRMKRNALARGNTQAVQRCEQQMTDLMLQFNERVQDAVSRHTSEE